MKNIIGYFIKKSNMFKDVLIEKESYKNKLEEYEIELLKTKEILDLLKKENESLNNYMIVLEKEKKYYSSYGEDVILNNIFFGFFQKEKIKNGFYVDIGAHHPTYASNTKLLYDEGWNGINIDANPFIKEVFDRERPRDINLNFAVTNTEGAIDYYLFGEKNSEYYGSSSTIDKNFKDYIEKTQKVVSQKISVPSAKLEYIFDKYVHDKKINFMNIDIERNELKALQSNNWNKYRPFIIAVEVLGIKNDILQEIIHNDVLKYLYKQKYKIFSIDLLTYFLYDTLSIEKHIIECWIKFDK